MSNTTSTSNNKQQPAKEQNKKLKKSKDDTESDTDNDDADKPKVVPKTQVPEKAAVSKEKKAPENVSSPKVSKSNQAVVDGKIVPILSSLSPPSTETETETCGDASASSSDDDDNGVLESMEAKIPEGISIQDQIEEEYNPDLPVLAPLACEDREKRAMRRAAMITQPLAPVMAVTQEFHKSGEKTLAAHVRDLRADQQAKRACMDYPAALLQMKVEDSAYRDPVPVNRKFDHDPARFEGDWGWGDNVDGYYDKVQDKFIPTTPVVDQHRVCWHCHQIMNFAKAVFIINCEMVVTPIGLVNARRALPCCLYAAREFWDDYMDANPKQPERDADAHLPAERLRRVTASAPSKAPAAEPIKAPAKAFCSGASSCSKCTPSSYCGSCEKAALSAFVFTPKSEPVKETPAKRIPKKTVRGFVPVTGRSTTACKTVAAATTTTTTSTTTTMTTTTTAVAGVPARNKRKHIPESADDGDAE